MDERDMRELLTGYFTEMTWAGGLTKEDIVAKLTGRDDALLNVVGHYVPEGTYPNGQAVMDVIPEQAWQDAQGDEWRGGAIVDTGGHFRDSPAARDS